MTTPPRGVFVMSRRVPKNKVFLLGDFSQNAFYFLEHRLQLRIIPPACSTCSTSHSFPYKQILSLARCSRLASASQCACRLTLLSKPKWPFKIRPCRPLRSYLRSHSPFISLRSSPVFYNLSISNLDSASRPWHGWEHISPASSLP